MQRMTAHSSVIQFKYFKVLVQEFLIRLDITFVNAMVELFSESGEQKLERMVKNQFITNRDFSILKPFSDP